MLILKSHRSVCVFDSGDPAVRAGAMIGQITRRIGASTGIASRKAPCAIRNAPMLRVC